MKNNTIRQRLLIIIPIALVAYGIWNARNIITGPAITIESPITNNSTKSNTLEVKGIAKNVSWLSLNGRQIFIDDNSNFKEVVLLQPGFNIIEVYGRDRFGEEKLKKIKIYKYN